MQEDEVRSLIGELVHALAVATARALENGARLVERGGSDINRGQFAALALGALEAAEQAGLSLSPDAARLLRKWRQAGAVGGASREWWR